MLLNEHLQFLDEKWFRNTPYRNSMKDYIYRLPNLKRISLSVNCGDESLENITKFCPKIIKIDASRSSVTDTGVKYLYKNENGKFPCPDLKKLSIDSSSVTDESLICLIQNLPSLEKINHKNVPHILYSLHKENLHDHEKLPRYNLTYLNLLEQKSLPYYTELLKICLTLCPRLKSISCYITDKEQLDFFNKVGLEELELQVLESHPKTDINNFLKNNGRNLVSLLVDNCIMSLNIFAVNCPNLRYLTVGNFTLSDDNDAQQSVFRCLTSCTFKNLNRGSTTNKTINSLLSSLPNLEDLTFRLCNLASYQLKYCENNNLETINIFNPYIAMKSIKKILLNCPSLKTLFIEHYDENDRSNIYEREALTEFVETLPNKPDIYVNDFYINDYDYDYEECRYNRLNGECEEGYM